MSQLFKPLLLFVAPVILAMASAALAQDTAATGCRVRVLVINHDWQDGTKTARGVLSENQVDWWLENAKKFPGVILVAEYPADYAISWAETWTTEEHTPTVPVTTTHSGTVSTVTGQTATNSGTSTTRETRHQERNYWWVHAELIKMDGDKPQFPPIFEAKHHGRWRLSKPDKDAFEKVINALSKDCKKK